MQLQSIPAQQVQSKEAFLKIAEAYRDANTAINSGAALQFSATGGPAGRGVWSTCSTRKGREFVSLAGGERRGPPLREAP